MLSASDTVMDSTVSAGSCAAARSAPGCDGRGRLLAATTPRALGIAPAHPPPPAPSRCVSGPGFLRSLRPGRDSGGHGQHDDQGRQDLFRRIHRVTIGQRTCHRYARAAGRVPNPRWPRQPRQIVAGLLARRALRGDPRPGRAGPRARHSGARPSAGAGPVTRPVAPTLPMTCPGASTFASAHANLREMGKRREHAEAVVDNALCFR
jgi:hypothetical protein